MGFAACRRKKSEVVIVKRHIAGVGLVAFNCGKDAYLVAVDDILCMSLCFVFIHG
jgi:predicted nucleotide-binding protein (sugar kinase/HSP70/actin superfamily)